MKCNTHIYSKQHPCINTRLTYFFKKIKNREKNKVKVTPVFFEYKAKKIFYPKIQGVTRSLLRGGDLEGGGSHGEGRGRLPKVRRGRGRGAKRVERVGGAATIGRRRGGRLGLGRSGGATNHRIEIKGPNTLSHLSSRP
jgi:hypothetical protein